MSAFAWAVVAADVLQLAIVGWPKPGPLLGAAVYAFLAWGCQRARWARWALIGLPAVPVLALGATLAGGPPLADSWTVAILPLQIGAAVAAARS